MPSVLISVPLNRISCEVWQMMSSVSTYFTFRWNSVGSCSSRENGTKKATFVKWVRGLVSAAAVSELSSLTCKRNVCSAAEALSQRTSFTWDPGGNVSLLTLSSHLGRLVLKQASSSGFVPVCASECGLTWLNNSVRWRMDVLSGRSFSLLQEPDYYLLYDYFHYWSKSSAVLFCPANSSNPQTYIFKISRNRERCCWFSCETTLNL